MARERFSFFEVCKLKLYIFYVILLEFANILLFCYFSSSFDLDLEIRKLSLKILEGSEDLIVGRSGSSVVFYATIYFCLNSLLVETNNFASFEDNLDWFKTKIITYDTTINEKAKRIDALSQW